MTAELVSLEDMDLFVRVVDLQSFTAAADRANVSKSSISRRLRALEEQLQVRLLERTTRSIQLTEVGELFYQRCLQTINSVQETQQLVSQANARPTGLLRIYAPNEFSRRHFQRLIPRFARRFPELELDIHSGTVGQHLIDDRYDVMIHISDPEDSSYIAKPVARVPTNYYVSQAYIDRRGEPQSPEELLQHDCIVERRNNTRQLCRWDFPADGSGRSVSIEAKYSSDSTTLCRAMVLEGMGIAMLPEHICRDALAEGRLKQLFGGRQQVVHTVYAVHPARRFPPFKVRAFIDFVVDELQGLFDNLRD